MHRLAAARVQLLQRYAVAAARRVVPVEAVAVVERSQHLGAGSVGKLGDQALGGFAHASCGSRRRVRLIVRERSLHGGEENEPGDHSHRHDASAEPDGLQRKAFSLASGLARHLISRRFGSSDAEATPERARTRSTSWGRLVPCVAYA